MSTDPGTREQKPTPVVSSTTTGTVGGLLPSEDMSVPASVPYDGYVNDGADEDAAGFCSLCDGLGHGYPGSGPCPLETRGFWDARADEEREQWLA